MGLGIGLGMGRFVVRAVSKCPAARSTYGMHVHAHVHVHIRTQIPAHVRTHGCTHVRTLTDAWLLFSLVRSPPWPTVLLRAPHTSNPLPLVHLPAGLHAQQHAHTQCARTCTPTQQVLLLDKELMLQAVRHGRLEVSS